MVPRNEENLRQDVEVLVNYSLFDVVLIVVYAEIIALAVGLALILKTGE